ncbi:uncharacterized protein LOC143904411 isoform X4 [Temnothorax americanus]|uniref:uncharacterized protein LOC143904411 isoform X4 n=1 Tax=Temnothorax americanus TaxID=1964332 RepID=UPI004069357F
METSDSMPPEMESPGEDIMLIETVKSIVTRGERNESEGTDEDFFLMSQDQSVQYPEGTVSATEVTLAWMHLCRICANASNHVIPIFEGDGAEHDLSSKIIKYLPIHVSESDTLPLQLCENCANILIAWHELHERCLSAEIKLLEMQDTQLRNKQQYYNPTSLDNLEVTTPMLTTASTTIESNITNPLPNQQDDDKNEACDSEKINKSNRWTRRVSKDESERRARVSSPRNEQSDMEGHINVEKARSTVSSEKCLASTHLDDFEEKLERDHSADSHPNSEKKCTPYKCEECGKVLSTSYNLLIHRNIHAGVRPYICSICDKSFRSTSGLNRHVRYVHDGVKNFACDVCGRHLASRASRDEHRRTHSGERLHVCETCGKSFKQKASLHVHRLYHSQVLPHRCVLCDRGFRRKQELDKHASWHSDRKPYACDICDERFRSKGCVTRHRRTHTNQRLHICAICGARFAQERYLKRHRGSLHTAVCT